MGGRVLILLDTHVLIWLTSGSPRLGAMARKKADRALKDGQLFVSAITYWETEMLAGKGRIEMQRPVDIWRQELAEAGLREVPVDGAIALAAARLEDFHGDPADRFIVATTRHIGAALLTADSRIHRWSGKVRRYDAAK